MRPSPQRLGISKIKIELDDLSLKYLEPEVYYDLVEKIALRKDDQGGLCPVRLWMRSRSIWTMRASRPR